MLNLIKIPISNFYLALENAKSIFVKNIFQMNVIAFNNQYSIAQLL